VDPGQYFYIEALRYLMDWTGYFKRTKPSRTLLHSTAISSPPLVTAFTSRPTAAAPGPTSTKGWETGTCGPLLSATGKCSRPPRRDYGIGRFRNYRWGRFRKSAHRSNPVEVGMSNTKNFKYSLPHESFVSLRIYDLAGRLVCSFINKKQAAGSYSIVLPVGNLRSGNYLYSFTAGEYHVQKRSLF